MPIAVMPVPEAPTCKGCKLALKGEFQVDDNGDCFHFQCFKCAKCGKAFRQGGRHLVRTTDSQERRFAQPSRYYHVHCAPALQDDAHAADPPCFICGQGRGQGRDEMLTTRRGDAVHLACFKCTACGKAVYTDADGKVKMTLLSGRIQQLREGTYTCDGCRPGAASAKPSQSPSCSSSEPKLQPPAPAGAPASEAHAVAPAKAAGVEARQVVVPPPKRDARHSDADFKVVLGRDKATSQILREWFSEAAAQGTQATVLAGAEAGSPAAPAKAAVAPVVPVALPPWTLKDLKDKDKCQMAGIPATKREAWLSDADFKVVFGMDMATFNALPAWRREQKKREQGLF